MSKIQIDDTVLAELKALRVEGNRVYMAPMARALYEKVNKVLNILGGEWNRAAKAHIFPEDPWDSITEAVMAEAVVDWKKTYQFFPTPDELARRVVTMASIEPHHRVLEPSAGSGALLNHCVGRKFYCELNPEMAAKLQATKGIGEFLQHDFMSLPNGEATMFDRVVMNPPFCKGQDVDHVNKAYDHLAKGGRLVAIMGPGWTFRSDAKHREFKSMVEKLQARRRAHWEELDPGAFKSSGTMVKTTLVRLDAI